MMKKIFYMAVAAIAALSSCSKDNDIIDGVPEPTNPNANAPVFTATIEGDFTSRTQLAEGSTTGKKKVEWLSDDKVFIWSIDANNTLKEMGYYDVAPNSSNASTATLTPVENIKYVNEDAGAAATTFAFYPYTMSEIDSKSEQQGFLDDYKAEGKGAEMESIVKKLRLSGGVYNGENISGIAPMVAVANGGTNLKFKNITALLAITVPASEFSSVQYIYVTTDKQMLGDFLFDPENMVAVPTMSAEEIDAYLELEMEMNKATLNCKNGNSNTAIPEGGSKTFYISIPANTYQNFKITVTDGTTTKMMRPKVGDLFIERSKVYNMTFKEDEPGTITPNLGNDNGYQF